MDKSKYLVGQLNITDIFSRSAGVAYYLTLSIFPSVMFLMCAFAYMPSIIGDFVEASIRTNVPAGASNILRENMESTIRIASFPETLIIPIAPPGCVATAQIVSLEFSGLLYTCII